MSRYRLHMTTVVCLAGLLLAIGCDTAWTESPDSIVTIPSQRPYENPGVIMGDPGSDIGPLTVQVFSPIKRGALGRNGRRDPVEGSPVDIGHEIAEMVHPQHRTLNAAISDRRHRNVEQRVFRHGPPECRELNTFRQPCGGRREPVTSFERLAHRWPGITALG